jgi:hypothetical protein
MLFSPLRRKKNRVPTPPRPSRRPLRLELLEDRLAPAVVNWSGGATGTGTDWNDNANWVGNARPGATDDAVIGSAFSGVTITSASNVSVNSVRSSAAIQVTGGTFTIFGGNSVLDGDLTVLGGSLHLSGANLNGLGTVTNNGDLVAVASTVVNTALDNEGSLEVQQGSSTFNGAFTNGSTGSVTIIGALTDFADANLNVANGFTNSGLITMTAGPRLVGQASTLSVLSGTLTNAASGTINVLPGTGGFRGFAGQLDNQGVLNVSQFLFASVGSASKNSGTINIAGGGLSLNQSGASSFTNSGTINVGGGGLSINQSGAFSSTTNTGTINVNDANLTLNQTNATTVFTNAGTVNVANARNLIVNGGEFDPDSGSLNGAVQLNGGAIGSGTLSSNAVVTLSSATQPSNATLTNQGLLIVQDFASTFNGTFSNASGATLRLLTQLTLANGLTNDGLIEMSTLFSNRDAVFSVLSGALTNASDGTINVLQGAGAARAINGQFDNQGTINVNNNSGLTLTHPNNSPAITNSGTINVNNSDLTLNQSGTTTIFDNTGTLNMSTGRTFVVNGGEFDPDSGTINGTMRLNGVALGSGTLSNNAVVTLSPGSETAGSTLVNQGQLFIQGGTTIFDGSFTNGENGLLQLGGGVGFASAVLTVTNDLTNFGVIQLTALQNGIGTTLNVTNGTLTNAPGALLETLVGSGGVHTVNAQLDNQGTINLNQRLTLSRTGATHSNSGVITVRADLTVNQLGATASFDNAGTINALSGNVLFSQTGTLPSFSNEGEIDIASMRTFTIDGGTFTNFAGNTLTGGTYNVAGTFKFTGANILTNAATLTLDGSGSQVVDQSNANALASLASNSGAFTLKNGRSFTRTGNFGNTGTVTVLGSTFTVNGTFTQTDGATVLGSGGTLAATGGVNILGGVLSGFGTVNADVANAAELDVGADGATGVLTINGNYTQTGTGVLNIQIGGSLPGTQFDQLVITKQAHLDGTLNVSLINSFHPATGATFKILTFAGSTGSFATVNIDQNGMLVLNPTDGTVKF